MRQPTTDTGEKPGMYLPSKLSGFTLVETAIVLVIIGLLAAAIVAGGELLGSARARTLITEIDGLKGAYFGFIDRYHGYPGDYPKAMLDIPNAGVNGNGNGLIEPMASGGSIDEHIAVWEHLSGAGFITGRYRYSAGAETPTSAPKTAFGAYPRIVAGQQIFRHARAHNAVFQFACRRQNQSLVPQHCRDTIPLACGHQLNQEFVRGLFKALL